MNLITIWNDFVPLNAKEIVKYAHDRGIKVVWGYSWCWGEEVNPTDEKELEKWTDRVFKTFEEQYLQTGATVYIFRPSPKQAKA
jgi:hypothetical protein